MKKIIFAGLILMLTILNSWSQQLAFPTAEGYGKYTTGGRGGAVYEVTTLNPTGAGSLGAAIAASGPRTVVFRVSGTITGNFSIQNDNITIAGQTAPGDGICIKGNLSTGADNIIIRYIRVRYDPSLGPSDAMGGRYQKNIIFDHVSASWSADEVMTLYHNENTTVQWCIISEACEKFEDGVSVEHRFGGIWGNNYGTWHHNLLAHNDNRNPRWASGCGYNDHRNNVLYNWGYGSCNGGEAHQRGDRRNPPIEHSTINMIANYYKAGPATGPKSRIADPGTRDGEADAGKWWLSDNVVEGYPEVTADNWKGFASTALYFRLSEPWNAMPINQQSPEDAYNYVLAHAGCSKPNRDTIDKRIIHEVRTGTATYGNNGIIDVPSDVGGWPALASGTPPVDTDHDGMPDSWEKDNGLDTANADDRNIVGLDGYTMLENYLNNLAGYIPVSVTGITFEPASDTVEKNTTIQLYPVFSPYNATNQIVTWSSSDTTVATVNESGTVKGIDSGTAVITATTKDGGFTADCTVEVFTISVTGVSVDPTAITLNPGKAKRLVATIEPANATDKSVTWESSNTPVATVSSTGYVRGVSLGSAYIRIITQDGNYTDSCKVDVVEVSALDQKSSEHEILVYPNPFTKSIIIYLKGMDNVNRLEVLNITGQVIKALNKDELNAEFVELNLDVPGNFFLVRINTDEKVYTKKMIRK